MMDEYFDGMGAASPLIQVPGMPQFGTSRVSAPLTPQTLFPTPVQAQSGGAKVMADSGPPGQTANAVKQWLDVFTSTAKEVDSYLLQRKAGSLPQQQIYIPPSDSGNKTLLYVGIGAVALIGVALIFSKKR